MTADYRFGRFELRPAARQLLVEGRSATLGGRAFDVLLALIERRERLVSKDELFDLAWPGLVVEENNLQVQISSLRKILGDGIIKTIPGHGYRFAAELETRPAAGPRSDNLPRALTRFFGHEVELDEYQDVFAASRLLTLTGVGGCGKTRLAIELAWRLMPMFPDGVWFVDLAPMAEPERLPSVVARTLGLPEQPGQSAVEALCERIGGKTMLLVLDNCEHLLGACAALGSTLMTRAGELKILATSREPLGLPGEQTLRVRSLSWPESDEVESDRCAAFEAVQLFVDRARLVQPDFRLDARTASGVAEICRRLDGIPLAIELAAARTKVCSVGELRGMLDERFRLLVGGSRTVPPRQQTLHAAIKWSFDLLTHEERRLLERLSVFSGGWTLESAVAVAGEGAGTYEVLDVLTHLVDKSLIGTHRREARETRYSMLETVRQFGREALAAAGADASSARRHLEYFVALAERLEPAFEVRTASDPVEQLEPELENIVQALRGCARLPKGPELGVRLVATLHEYWVSLGLIELGYQLTSEVLALPVDTTSSRARARALFGATRCARFLGKSREAQVHASESHSLARSVNDDHLAVAALAYLGIIAINAGDSAKGIALCEETLRLARDRGYIDQAGRALNMIGWAHLTSCNLELASSCFEESLLACREWGDGNAIAMVACNVAHSRVLRGGEASASPLLLEAVDLASSTKSKWTMLNVLDAVTMLATAAHAWQAAARMLGAAEAARKLLLGRDGWVEEWGIATAIGNALPEVEFEAAYDAGNSLTLERGMGEARAWLEAQSSA